MSADNNRGFTLIEVIIALAVFSIGIFSTFLLNGIIIKGNASADRISDATSMGSDRLERLFSEDYTSANFVDGGGSTAGSAGLDDVPPAKNADGSFVDGPNTVYWNVAPNYPATNMKTVRVIVRNRLMNTDSKFTTVKIRNT